MLQQPSLNMLITAVLLSTCIMELKGQLTGSTVEVHGWQSSCSSRETNTQRPLPSPMECAQACSRTISCHFVNFDTTSKVCTLVSKDAQCSYLPVSTSVLAATTTKHLTIKPSTDIYVGRQIAWLVVDDKETCKKLCQIVAKCNASVFRRDGACSLKTIPQSAEFGLDKTATAFVDLASLRP
ncbi:uncharacterized protein LOC129601762 [Paramacrobiotus metropolitanus]|uniref:uncharacterized protein LOC129601762 n=1 Tax=Paramacrobiotus metropolitanus TaxID=2943436 RepID=UPI002445986D|nr:uncharacterized protein LOC129601762 [Paramacrobiotus metropolitanus]